jgi:hypothetical protein
MSISPEQSKIAFQRTERALVKLSSGRDAESVHSFRTTTLRLQTLLEQLIPNRDRNQKKLLKMLDRIRRRAGKVRDLDVQLTALRSLKVPQEPRRKTQLTQGLLELRVKHEKKLRKLLTKWIVQEIQKRLKRASKEVELKAGRDPLQVARTALSQIARPTGPDYRGPAASVPQDREAGPIYGRVRSQICRGNTVRHPTAPPAGCRRQLARLADSDPDRGETDWRGKPIVPGSRALPCDRRKIPPGGGCTFRLIHDSGRTEARVYVLGTFQ